MRRDLALLLAAIALAGCGTVPGPAPQSRDGETYGIVDGTFRGRWWNHYERGRSFLDGGFYAEAMDDLRIAASLRSEDQRWARTYGLHFLPEYFPNREMGIALYHEGKIDEAQRRLEASLAQEPSALAEHYLDLVRAAKIQAGGGDSTPPVVDARLSDENDALVLSASDDHFLANILVDDQPAFTGPAETNTTVRHPVTLRPGANTFTVVATDLLGNRTESVVQVEHDADGPAVQFVADAGLGEAWDPSGVAAVEINGIAVALQPQPDGAVRFRASPTAPAMFVARDRRGNVTEGRVPAADGTRAASRIAPLRLAAAQENTFAASALVRAQLAQETADGEGEIAFTNLTDGQRYLMDEIVVGLEARDPAGIREIRLDNVPLAGTPQGATHLHLSRRLRLAAMGPHQVVAELVDANGTIHTRTVTIERSPTALELPEERLRVALLGSLWDGAGERVEGEAAFTAEELARAIFIRRRFDLLSRDALPRVLEEQELRAVLGAREDADTLRAIAQADVFAVGKVRRTGDTVEIVLQAVSGTSAAVLAYADVAGEVKTLDDLRALTRDLALRFEQEFPRVAGKIVQAGDKACYTGLGEADRVRSDLPCVVYRLGADIVDPGTGAVLGKPVEILARGQFSEVRRQLSRIALDPGAQPVQVDDHVATR